MNTLSVWRAEATPTGFGALPKYLPFLPERTGFLTPPPQPVAPDGEPYIDEPEPARRDFWTALEKLQAPLPGEVAVATGSEGAPTVHSGKRVARPPKAKRPRGTSPGASTGDTTNADA